MFCGVNIFIGKSHLDFRIELVAILHLLLKNPVTLTLCCPIARRSMGRRTSWDATGGQSQMTGMKHVINSQASSFIAGYCLVYPRFKWTTTLGSLDDWQIGSETEIEAELRSIRDVIAFKKNRTVVQKAAIIYIKLWSGSNPTFILHVGGSRMLLWREFSRLRYMP